MKKDTQGGYFCAVKRHLDMENIPKSNLKLAVDPESLKFADKIRFAEALILQNTEL